MADNLSGLSKMISFFAKRARGMMARYIIQNKINDGKDILSFNIEVSSFLSDTFSI